MIAAPEQRKTDDNAPPPCDDETSHPRRTDTVVELDPEQQARLVRALSRPEVWPHPAEHIEVRETHISWVLLVGEFAYKLKKAVDFGFLDYATLARRKAQCERELVLNRRLAPELYLGVIPVTGTPEAPRPGGPGKAIEYLVQMRRFDEAQLLSRVLARGELNDARMAQLAQVIADFQARAERAEPGSPFGAPETVWHFVEENFSQIAEALGSAEERALQDLADWSRSRFEVLAPYIEQRQHEGFVRDGHGDLHLNNLVLIGDRPVPFDCIEFNDRLRIIDVVNELAFLYMDLQARGHPALATWLLNEWLFRSGDYPGVRLLRFFAAYRAMVRAKVAALRLRQTDPDAEERTAQIREYRDYVTLAREHTRAGSPRLVITHGLSGSGKSTLAHRLLARWPAIHLRSDVERKRLYGLAMDAKSDSAVAGGIYTPEATERTYARLAELAGMLLEAGWPVVVDATFLDARRRETFRQLARVRGMPFTVLDLQAPPDVLRERVRRRQALSKDPSEADVQVLEHQLAGYRPIPVSEPDVLRIDASGEFDVTELASKLGAGKG